MGESNPKTWAVTLTPHRSLGRGGFIAIMAVIVLFNCVFGLTFYLLGAWPVLPFMGADLALAWFAFRASFAAARRAERIEITPHELILERLTNGLPPRQTRFLRRWLSVELEIDRKRCLIGGLYLQSRGIRTEIAKFLGPHERRELAAALKSALASPHT